MEITLELNPEMSDELTKAARDCRCASPRQFALDAIESCLASRRLPDVYVPVLTQGAQMRGTRGQSTHEDEDVELEGYRVHWPEGISGAQE